MSDQQTGEKQRESERNGAAVDLDLSGAAITLEPELLPPVDPLDVELGRRFDALIAQLAPGDTVFYIRDDREGRRGWYHGVLALDLVPFGGPHVTPERAALEGVFARGSSSPEDRAAETRADLDSLVEGESS